MTQAMTRVTSIRHRRQQTSRQASGAAKACWPLGPELSNGFKAPKQRQGLQCNFLPVAPCRSVVRSIGNRVCGSLGVACWHVRRATDASNFCADGPLARSPAESSRTCPTDDLTVEHSAPKVVMNVAPFAPYSARDRPVVRIRCVAIMVWFPEDHGRTTKHAGCAHVP